MSENFQFQKGISDKNEKEYYFITFDQLNESSKFIDYNTSYKTIRELCYENNFVCREQDRSFIIKPNLPEYNIQLGEKLEEIITNNGFAINYYKVRLQPHYFRQEVTGVIVNKKINITRKYYREVRVLLNWWEKYGFPQATTKYIKYHDNKSISTVRYKFVILGKINFIKQVRGENDPVYLKLKEQYQNLIKPKEVARKEENGLNALKEKNDNQIHQTSLCHYYEKISEIEKRLSALKSKDELLENKILRLRSSIKTMVQFVRFKTKKDTNTTDFTQTNQEDIERIQLNISTFNNEIKEINSKINKIEENVNSFNQEKSKINALGTQVADIDTKF